MMRRGDRAPSHLPIYDGLIAIGICLMAYTVWTIHAKAAIAEHKMFNLTATSNSEAKKTAKLEADAKIIPVKAEIKTLQAKQSVVVKDAVKLEAEAADLKRRFKHVQSELDMCRISNNEKQKQIDAIRMRQYERFMELRANHYRNQERIGRIEKLLGLATKRE